MKPYHKHLIMIVILLCIFLGKCTSETIEDFRNKNNKDILIIPKENKIELDKVWEIQMDAQQANYAIDGDVLYIVSENKTIYMVNIHTGEIIKSFKADVDDSGVTMGVYNDVIAINYDYKIVVIDTKTQKIILNHEEADPFSVAISYNILMHKDLVIFSNILKDKIYAINYHTGEIAWEYGKDRGHFKLYQYKDKYLFRNNIDHLTYYQFDPLTGEIINKYAHKFVGEIKNEDLDEYIPKFNNIEDEQFEQWLMENSFGVFVLTKKGYIYTDYGYKFYFYGTDTNLDWMIRLPKEINSTYSYGRYTFLNLYDSVALLDLENKKMLWNIENTQSRGFIYKERLCLSGKDGKFMVFDLSKLEK